jgi:hypothetical protein
VSVRIFAGALCVLTLVVADGEAQEHQHHQPSASPELAIPEAREGSGTSWMPDGSTMVGIHGPTLGGWETMLHGVGFVQYLRDEKPRGSSQFGSINWIMGHARRGMGAGTLAVRGMVSLEPITIRGCGYPDLLASGEVCDGHGIVDQQHPHDLVMEAAALYARPLSSRIGLQLYGGLAGEPALGPVAFPHRLSAMMNPLAPVSHHWLDATHITYGVVTGGLYGTRWKVESSIFNGREPDEERYDLDLAAMDSYAGRVSFLPTARWALQLSAGHLEEAEEHEPVRVNVERVTASAMHHRPLDAAGFVATTVAWGRNVEEGLATHAVVAETSVSLTDRYLIFARGELAQKTSHDLDLHGTNDEVFTIGKLQIGYSRFLAPVKGWRAGLGGSVSVGILPDGLSSTYGGRAPLGFGVFLTVRPVAMAMAAASQP